MPHEIRVRGRLVYWPVTCACCAGPADDSFPLPSRAARGDRDVGEAPRLWQVPYCRACLRHVRHATRVGTPPRGAGLATALAFTAVGAAAWIFGNLGIFVLVTVTLALGAAALLSLWQRKREAAAAEAAALCHGGCAGPGPAAAYRGWDASGHAFTFTNLAFAESFAEANALEDEPAARSRSRRVQRVRVPAAPARHP
jgi:hypothetical protein